MLRGGTPFQAKTAAHSPDDASDQWRWVPCGSDVLPNDLLLVRQLKSHQLGNVHEVVPFVGRVDAPRHVADEEEGTSECAQSSPTAERLSQHTPKYVVQQLCRRQTAQHSNVNGSRDLSTHFGSMRHWGSVPIINSMPRARKCCRGTPQYSSTPTTLHHYRTAGTTHALFLGLAYREDVVDPGGQIWFSYRESTSPQDEELWDVEEGLVHHVLLVSCRPSLRLRWHIIGY